MRKLLTPVFPVLFLSLASFALALVGPESRAALPANSGPEFRRLVHDFVEAAGAPDKPEQARQIRLLLASRPEIFRWLAEEDNLTSLLEKADLGAVASALQSGGTGGNLPAWAAKEFVDSVQKSMETLPEELGLKERILYRLTKLGPRFKISRFKALELSYNLQVGVGVFTQLRQILRESGTTDYVATRRKIYDYLGKLSVSDRQAILGLAGDYPLTASAKLINEAIGGMKISELGPIHALSDPQTGINLEGVDEGTRRFLEKIMGGYFDVLDVADKRRMILAVLALEPGASTRQQLQAALNSSGPLIQKALQLYAKDAKSELIRDVAAEMLSSIKPDPMPAKQLVEQALGMPVDQIFSEFDEKPIKAATIGNVHRARLRATGELVAVKVRRSGVKERLEREIGALRKLDDSLVYQNFLNGLAQAIGEELDYRIEAANVDAGAVYRSARLGIQSLGRPDLPLSDSVLVTSWAEGKPLESIALNNKEDLLRAGRALSNLLDRWYEEAMFDSGFFHGDLHPGNIFLAPKPGKKPPFAITPIDYGSAGKLTLAERQGFAKLFLAALGGSGEDAMAALKAVSRIPPEAEGKIRKHIYSVMGRRDLPYAKKIEMILADSLLDGMEIPPDLIKFGRGKRFLDSQLEAVNRELDKLDPRHKLERFDPNRAVIRVTIRRAVPQLYRQLTSAEARHTSVIKLDQLTNSLLAQRHQVYEYFAKLAEPCARTFARLVRRRDREPTAIYRGP